MSSSDHDADFYAGCRTVNVLFVVDDDVEVLQGDYAGRRGAVVALDRSREPFRFLVEFGDGTDELLEAADLTLRRPAA